MAETEEEKYQKFTGDTDYLEDTRLGSADNPET